MLTRPFYCEKHPQAYACREHEGKWICWECFKALPGTRKRPAVFSERAYATGLGSEAAQESREAQAYQEEYDNLKPVAQSWRVKE